MALLRTCDACFRTNLLQACDLSVACNKLVMLSVAMKDLVLFAVMLTNTAMSDEAVTRFDADPVVCCVAMHCIVKLIQRPRLTSAGWVVLSRTRWLASKHFLSSSTE